MAEQPMTKEKELIERPCKYCGGAGRFQIVSNVSDHAWADCFCQRTLTPSGDRVEAVARAIWERRNPPSSGFVSWERAYATAKRPFVEDARAAITAYEASARPESDVVEALECERCSGTGEIGEINSSGNLITPPCPACDGAGTIPASTPVRSAIPNGVGETK